MQVCPIYIQIVFEITELNRRNIDDNIESGKHVNDCWDLANNLQFTKKYCSLKILDGDGLCNIDDASDATFITPSLILLSSLDAPSDIAARVSPTN